MYFCVGHGTLVMENFCWAWNFWSWENIFVVVGHVICGHGKIFVVGHVICGHGKFFWTCNIWSNFVCRTSRAKGAFKCWKAYGKYCLWILRTSLMKPASNFFPSFTELGMSWVQGSPVTPCFVKTVLGYHVHIPFSGHWWSDANTLRLLHHHLLEIGQWKNQDQWFTCFKRD